MKTAGHATAPPLDAAYYRPLYSVTEFCEAHRISRSLLYRLLKNGTGPRILKLGNRTLISAEAAADWRKAMER